MQITRLFKLINGKSKEALGRLEICIRNKWRRAGVPYFRQYETAWGIIARNLRVWFWPPISGAITCDNADHPGERRNCAVSIRNWKNSCFFARSPPIYRPRRQRAPSPHSQSHQRTRRVKLESGLGFGWFHECSNSLLHRRKKFKWGHQEVGTWASYSLRNTRYITLYFRKSFWYDLKKTFKNQKHQTTHYGRSWWNALQRFQRISKK